MGRVGLGCMVTYRTPGVGAMIAEVRDDVRKKDNCRMIKSIVMRRKDQELWRPSRIRERKKA